MEIVIRKKVTPRQMTETNVDSLRSRIQRGIRYGLISSSTRFGNGIHAEGSKTVRVYNLQKQRPKRVQSDKKTYDGRDGKIAVTKITERGHWTAAVYDIPIDMLQLAGLKVRQGARTFQFEDEKGKRFSLREYKAMI